MSDLRGEIEVVTGVRAERLEAVDLTGGSAFGVLLTLDLKRNLTGETSKAVLVLPLGHAAEVTLGVTDVGCMAWGAEAFQREVARSKMINQVVVRPPPPTPQNGTASP